MRKFLCIATAGLLFAACGTAPGNGEEAGAGSAAARPASKVSYYSGSGGKGVSITVVAPEGKNLGQEDSYLLSLVQNITSGDFTKYSAMSVKDWASLSRVLAEIESVVYTENGDFIEAGNIAQTRYLLTGELAKTGGAYALQLTITDAKTGDNKASYAKSVSYQELASMEAINAAAADLLAQMGVALTQAGKDSLLGSADRRTLEAETALAKGAAAQRNGSTVAALNYYSQAADLRAGLTEADQRLAALTKQIESGDIGQNIRNDIERRNAWKKLLDEAIAFYQQNPYLNLVYYVKPQIGKTDYSKNTTEVSYNFWIEPNAGYPAMLKIVRALLGTGKAQEWGLAGDIDMLISIFPLTGWSGELGIPFEAELLSEQEDFIAVSGGYVGVRAGFKTDDFRYTSAKYAEPDTPVYVTVDYKGDIKFSAVDAGLISENMRLFNIKLLKTKAEAIRMRVDMNIHSDRLPITGPIRIIPSAKPRAEYFNVNQRNIKVSSGWEGTRISFTFP